MRGYYCRGTTNRSRVPAHKIISKRIFDVKILITAIFSLMVSMLLMSPAPGVAKDSHEVQPSRRDSLEKKFGKYYGSFEDFEIYGVKKITKPGDTSLASLVGNVIYPPDKKYSSVSISAEVKNKTGFPIRCSTTDGVWKSFAWIQDVNPDKPSPGNIGYTDFKWAIPYDTEASSLRITRIVAK